MSEKKFDLVVIGSGPGGYVASIVAAQKGMKVANIEKSQTLGGTCLNVGCIPSKAMLYASEQYENSTKKNGNEDWGINYNQVSLDLPKLLNKKSSIVEELTKGIDFLFKKINTIKNNPIIKIIKFFFINYNKKIIINLILFPYYKHPKLLQMDQCNHRFYTILVAKILE